MNKYLYNVDFFRIFFVMVIVYYHFVRMDCVQNYNLPMFQQLSYNIAWAGAIGNAALFIIAGYFFYASFLKHKEIFQVFVLRKLIRFYPVLCFAILMVMIFGAMGLTLCGLPKFDLNQNILNLFLITKGGGGLTNKLTNVYVSWFVCSWFWGSLFYYGLYHVCRDEFKFHFLVSIIVYLGLVIYVNSSLRDQDVIFGVISKGFDLAISCIGLGILIFAGLKNVNCEAIKMNKIFITILETACVFFLTYYCIFHRFSGSYIVCIAVFTLLFIMMILECGYLSQMLNRKIFKYIARYAFAIYIMQDVSFVLLKNFLWKQSEIINNFPALMLFLSVCFVAMLGVVTYYCIELPVSNYLNKLLHKKNNEVICYEQNISNGV